MYANRNSRNQIRLYFSRNFLLQWRKNWHFFISFQSAAADFTRASCCTKKCRILGQYKQMVSLKRSICVVFRPLDNFSTLQLKKRIQELHLIANFVTIVISWKIFDLSHQFPGTMSQCDVHQEEWGFFRQFSHQWSNTNRKDTDCDHPHDAWRRFPNVLELFRRSSKIVELHLFRLPLYEFSIFRRE